MIIRKASFCDLSYIANLVEVHAHRGQILPRSKQEIRDSINNWIVVSQEQAILACGSLVFYSPQLAEVRSLVVDELAQGRGLGMGVVQALIAEAKHNRVDAIFALTRVVPFFQRAGFTLSDKTWFPEKVRRDCALCLSRENCDENAVVLHLNGATSLAAKTSFKMKGVFQT